ncbi:Ig-like domain-containing protein [Patescibacteria group bacterium]
MKVKLLNLSLKFSSFVFSIKQKMLETRNWFKILFYAFIIIVLELVFAIISFPIYLIVSPLKVQEEGFIFPSLHIYKTKRKISLMAFWGIGGLFLLKLLFITLVSFYLLGGQALLAATQDWTFDTAGNYVYDSAKIEVIGEVASLKNLSGITSGNTINSGFDSDAIGWTAVPDWDNAPGKTNIANYQSSGGNPGGYVDINLIGKQANDSAGYWYQAFTTTVDTPDTATLDLDWKAIAITNAPSSYHFYVFVDTDSGDPIIDGATQVWDSGNISDVTDWAEVSTIDISSKVPTAGTYYLKIAAYHMCQSGKGNDCTTVSGFDDVIINWSKTIESYAIDNPTINPATSLNLESVTSWDSFIEISTKNGGDIYYQLSDDDGLTWQYWNGLAWASAGASDYNTASVVNSNISDFSAVNNKIMWKAFLESDGSQQVIIDNIAISYTENDAPDILNLSSEQDIASGLVYIDYNLSDNESDPSNLVVYEYSLTGIFGGEEAIMTASTTDLNHDGISGLSSSPIGVSHTFAWDAQADVGNIYDSSVYIRMRANDGIVNGSYTYSSAFLIDYAVPVISNVSVVQAEGTTTIDITYDLTDNTGNDLEVEIDISDDSGSTWDVIDDSVIGDVGSGITSGSKIITWDAGVDFDNEEQEDMRIRLKAIDSFGNISPYFESSDFEIDTDSPLGLLSLNKFASSNTTVTLNWTSGITDANFNHYELWHGYVSDDVDSRTISASEWDQDNDASLTDINTISTIITSLSITDNYYVKIWAVDDFGNEATVASINIYEPAPEPSPVKTMPSAGGGGGFIAPDTIPPTKPILSSLTTPTNSTQIVISGLAESRSRINLYDKGILVGRLMSAVDNAGKFIQSFVFSEGEHILTVRAIDFSNNLSQFSNPITLLVDLTPPNAPILLSPSRNEEIIDATPAIIGVSEPFALVNIIVDGLNVFSTTANSDGSWSYILSDESALLDGLHSFVIRAIDTAGNISRETFFELNKIAAPSVAEQTLPEGTVPVISIPSEAEIAEIIEAIELPGASIPEINNIDFGIAEDIIRFSGVALPNKEIVVYIHSDQALAYRVKSNQQGIWIVDHSQDIVELSPGEHSIFAVTVDIANNFKSQASAVSLFTVEKSLWVSLFNLLNLWTTVIVLIIILMTMLWLYKLKKQGKHV